MKRHWSFIVCDTKILYPITIGLISLGIILSIYLKDPTIFNRFGNLIIGVGVWMSMRYTFREGINKHKNALDSSPVLPKQIGHKMSQLNANYFNNKTFSIGDAKLSIKGFFLVVIGSIIGSFGDLFIKFFIHIK